MHSPPRLISKKKRMQNINFTIKFYMLKEFPYFTFNKNYNNINLLVSLSIHLFINLINYNLWIQILKARNILLAIHVAM